MKKFWYYSLVLIGISQAIAAAGDTSLSLSDATKIILHADYTWEFAKCADTTLIGDMPVTLTNGRSLVVAVNKTWRFTDGRDGDMEESGIDLETVYATGIAQQTTYESALATARKEVARRLVLQLLSAIPPTGMADTSFFGCIETVPKQEEISKKKRSVWEVTVKTTLNKAAIQAAIACMQVQSPAP
jgi:hypothetical protein